MDTLTERCFAILFSNRFDISAKAWVHAALGQLGTYGFPSIIEKIKRATRDNHEISTRFKCYWYMDSFTARPGNSEETRIVNGVAKILQNLSTETKWTDRLTIDMTFHETIECMVKHITNDSISFAKGRLALYQMLVFVLNHFQHAHNPKLFEQVEKNEFLKKCLSGLAILSGSSSRALLPFLPQQATGFGFGLNMGKLLI